MSARVLLITGLLFISTKIFSQDPNFHIYLCFGQSNMEGQGTIENKDKTVDSRFKVFQALDCSNLGRTKAAWFPAVPPTCQCWSGLSPADYFGRTMVANLPDSISVGVINVAVGGCDIRLFDKDIYQAYDSTYIETWFFEKIKAYEGNPYEYLISLATLAQEDGVIKGILLHQGETNTGDVHWPSYVKKIYNDMLTDLALNADSIPLLAGELVSAEENCCSSMNTIINQLPDTIPNAWIISSKGCTAKDNAHFDSEGYRKLGRRYGVKMLSLIGYEAFYLEAECGVVGDSCLILEDTAASNASYVRAASGAENISEGPIDDTQMVRMDFTLHTDTNYFVYGRFNMETYGENSYWVKVDDGEFELMKDLTAEGWQWIEINSYELIAGEHSVQIAFAGKGTSLDKLVIKNSQITPVEAGEEVNNLCVPELTPLGLNLNNSADGFALEQNYPNPFTVDTSISFNLPETTYASLKVLNSQGIEVTELASNEFHAGKHIIKFELKKLLAGNYHYIIETEKLSATNNILALTK